MLALYQISLPRGITAGLETSPGGVVVNAAPVLRKSVGLHIERVRQWAERKGGSLKLISKTASLTQDEYPYTGRV